MMLLSDEEILSAVRGFYGTPEGAFMGSLDDIQTARAIEAAILAKLASAELPEPADRFVFAGADWHRATPEYFKQSLGKTNCIAAYSADQLRQAYAQGAAAQLSAEPLCHVRDGEINRWNGLSGMGFSGPLYTRKEASK